jgi:hypothetical protein
MLYTGNLDKIKNFLELIHPFLKEDTYKNECIEIRAIGRQKNLKPKNINFWRTYDEKAQAYFEKFFSTSINKPYCIYYSVFSLDYNKRTYRPDGTEYPKGYINSQNSVFTQILVADFDSIQEKEYLKYYGQFLDMGIEPLTVFTGHGYQLIILLKEKCYDKDVLKHFNRALIDKGFPIDEQVIDSARVMRLPYTYNNKEFDENNSYYTDAPKRIETYILHSTTKRYSVEEVFSVLGKSINLVNSSDINKVPIVKQNQIIPTTYKKELFDKLPKAIQNMLTETREHFRNKVLLFLVPYFRNTENLSVEDIKDIMSVWATRCKPALDVYYIRSEVERLLNYEFKGKCGKYSDDMRKEFGELNLDEYLHIAVKTGNVVYPNTFFQLYDSLHPCSIKIYLMLKVKEHLIGKKEFTIEEIAEYTNAAIKTIYKYMPELVKFSLVYKKNACRKTNTPALYILPEKYDFSRGYTLINAGVIENMIFNSSKALLDSEIKLISYLYSIVGSDKKECWPSVRSLEKKLNISYNRISELTSSLNDKEYLIKETYKGEDGNYHSRYRLNYVSKR